MSPEKLFDYLEGNLPEAERARLEQQLASDPQLQRELAIAREMHKRSRGSREVLGESDDQEIPSPESGKLGRRLAAAFAILVMVNVLVGIAFIIGKKKQEQMPADLRARELAMRQQLAASLQKTVETTMPSTSLSAEIRLPARADERSKIADNVVLLATQSGGSAVKAPADDKGINVVAEIPANREEEFRRSLALLAPSEFSLAPTPTATATTLTDKRTIIQVRVGDLADSSTP
jgi:anti-sigma factor RsiW